MSDGTPPDVLPPSRLRRAGLDRVLPGRSRPWAVPPPLRAVGRFLAAHTVFLAVVGGAIALRVVAMLGFPSVLWFGDSRTYVTGALDMRPSTLRPSGYSLILAAIRPFHGFTGVLVVQHAMGVLAGVMVYALLQRALRRGWPRLWIWVPGVIASVLTLPVLYDAYEIQLEHMLMADVPFTFMLIAGITLAMWWRKTPLWAGAVAGLVIGAAADVRSVGLPMLIVLAFCLAVRRAGWRTVTATVVAGVAPLVGYMIWFHSYNGQWAFTSTDKVWLYGRVADFADCTKIKPKPELQLFCQDKVIRDPEVAAAFQAMWTSDSPFDQMPWEMDDPRTNKLAGEFAMQAIEKQPGDYAYVVWRDTWRAFDWKRVDYPNPGTVEEYRFPEGGALRTWNAMAAYDYGGRTAESRVVEPYGDFMRDYQSHYFMPGTFLGILLGAGLVGVVLRIRRFGGPVLLPFGVGLALLVVPAATADFDYRYVLPTAPFAVLAAGLALTREPRRETAPAPAVPSGEPGSETPEPKQPDKPEEPEEPEKPEADRKPRPETDEQAEEEPSEGEGPEADEGADEETEQAPEQAPEKAQEKADAPGR
ncbi:hypothetical protein [Actinomadura harenae]|uniref:Glycosyltransferase RgtA/B/C/D-like domain-containing protein n=1 Tax=Actinomadura harenae TaxID=2483351 RepID=A0A3M2MEA4_9ACTN|nr:hypothetical protein [Actinomadura harenae]RMI46975.1 hypothetical protein EBO15_04960 [Actinomadura harenae]